MTTFVCTWEQYKQAQKQFHDELPTMDRDEADNAFKCLALHYFGMTEQQYEHGCFIAFQIASREYSEHLFSLEETQND